MSSRLLFAALVAIFVSLPRVALAQITGATTGGATLTIYQETSLPRLNSNKVQINKRGLQYTPEGISYQDCIDGQYIRFPLQMQGFVGNAIVQAWGSLNGTDCSAVTARTGAVAQCWPLLSSNITLQLNQNVDIPVQEIMAGAPPNTPLAPVPKPSICGLVDLVSVQVQFLYFDPGNPSQASATQAVTIQIDTVGPAAPSGISTLPGDTRIYVNWDSISGEGGVSVLTGVKVYCDDQGSTGVPTACPVLLDAGIPTVDLSQIGDSGTSAIDTGDDDASTTHSNVRSCIDVTQSDGGTTQECTDGGDDDDDDGGTVVVTTSDASSLSDGGACTNSNFTPTSGLSVVPSALFDSCFLCGSVLGNTGTSVIASSLRGSPLVDDHHYSVAVAATDAFNNVGPLSSVLCEYPELTNDFWRNYKNAGGGAGGCDTSGDEAPIGSLGALAGVLAVGFSLVRRRRKDSR